MSLRIFPCTLLCTIASGLWAAEPPPAADPPHEVAALRQDVEQLRKIVLTLQARVDELESARGPAPITQLASLRQTPLVSPAQESVAVAKAETPAPPASGAKAGPITFNG